MISTQRVKLEKMKAFFLKKFLWWDRDSIIFYAAFTCILCSWKIFAWSLLVCIWILKMSKAWTFTNLSYIFVGWFIWYYLGIGDDKYKINLAMRCHLKLFYSFKEHGIWKIKSLYVYFAFYLDKHHMSTPMADEVEKLQLIYE